MIESILRGLLHAAIYLVMTAAGLFWLCKSQEPA